MGTKISPKIAGILFGATSGQTHPLAAAVELAREVQASGAADLRGQVREFKGILGRFAGLADHLDRLLGPDGETPSARVKVTVKEGKR